MSQKEIFRITRKYQNALIAVNDTIEAFNQEVDSFSVVNIQNPILNLPESEKLRLNFKLQHRLQLRYKNSILGGKEELEVRLRLWKEIINKSTLFISDNHEKYQKSLSALKRWSESLKHFSLLKKKVDLIKLIETLS